MPDKIERRSNLDWRRGSNFDKFFRKFGFPNRKLVVTGKSPAISYDDDAVTNNHLLITQGHCAYLLVSSLEGVARRGDRLPSASPATVIHANLFANCFANASAVASAIW